VRTSESPRTSVSIAATNRFRYVKNRANPASSSCDMYEIE
jgi:hypothetical protein